MVIIGGGPGGYEAALVASQLAGQVTLIEDTGLGGAAVLTDCVPSKSLIAAAEVMTTMERAAALGLHFPGDEQAKPVEVNISQLNARVRDLAAAQSRDITARLRHEGVQIVAGRGRLINQGQVLAETSVGEQIFEADIILVATGTTPRELPAAPCDGDRILNWKQLYELESLPERLIVVGSGVTGAEFSSAYDALGVEVVLVSSRSQVLPGQDQDAASVLQRVFERRGMAIYNNRRAVAATATGDEVVVGLDDGTQVVGSHCLMAVGAIPNTADIGLTEAGIRLSASGHIEVDRVSRTNVRTIYAAGDVTGVYALASVAAMQGRIAMYHALGDAVAPLDLRKVSANVFTSPEIATVGVTQAQVDSGELRVASVLLPLTGNARAKMQGFTDGFIKLFALPTTGIIVGGVVVAPNASELIHSVAVAVGQRISVDEFSLDFTVYPSITGSLAEAARRLHNTEASLTS